MIGIAVTLNALTANAKIRSIEDPKEHAVVRCGYRLRGSN